MPVSLDTLPRPVKTYHSKTYDRILPKNSTFKGKGKTVFITGGATGVGFSIAKAFAETGVERIVIVSRSAGPQEEAKKDLENAYPATKVINYLASISDAARMKSILQEVNSIDVMVLCAAVTNDWVPAPEVPNDALKSVYEINVFAAFDLIKGYLALPLPASGRKTLINVSSAAAHMIIPGQLVYGSSKAAVTQIVQHFAAEQNPDKVKMSSFHPGAFYTPTASKHAAEDAFLWEDIDMAGHFAVYLASDESSHLHGRIVWAQWDVDELAELKDRIAKDSSFLTIGLVQ